MAIMSGLGKPRGRALACPKKKYPANHRGAASGEGGLGKPGGRAFASRTGTGTTRGGGGLFVSSYHNDKQRKYRRQSMERTKRWIAVVMALGLFAAALWSRSSSEPTPPKNLKSKATSEAKISKEELSADSYVCGRRIPFPLADRSRWPTEHTALKSNVDGAKEAILLKKDETLGNLGTQLSSFFHAFDLSHDTGRPLYVTKDSWVFDTLFPLFFGPAAAVEQYRHLWKAVREVLGNDAIVEDEAALKKRGMSYVHHTGPQGLFRYSSKKLDPTTIRNHRNTILRQLFRYPATNRHAGNRVNVCSIFEPKNFGKDIQKKYAVIHVADPKTRESQQLTELNKNTGKDHGAANAMSPDYAISILKRTGMLEHDVFLFDGGSGLKEDDDVHKKFANAARAGNIKVGNVLEKFKQVGSDFYLAVLADVYLGNPVDQTSLWIARMRYALGMKNTFIFTEQKKGGEWVSYLDDDKYLDLYDVKKLGIDWMG